MQPHHASFPVFVKAFQRRRAVVDKRDHDLAFQRFLLLPDDDKISVVDPGARHGVAVGPYQKEPAPSEDRCRETDVRFNVFLFQKRRAAGDRPQNRRPGHIAPFLACARRLDLFAVITDQALFIHFHQIMVCRAAAYADRVRDLRRRRRTPVRKTEFVGKRNDPAHGIRISFPHNIPPGSRIPSGPPAPFFLLSSIDLFYGSFLGLNEAVCFIMI